MVTLRKEEAVILNRWSSGALAVLLGVAVVQSLRLDAARERVRLAGLGADSVQAAADSGRSSFYVRVQALGDSLRVAERRAVQTVQRADVLDRVLRLERRVRDSLRVAVERLRRQARSDSVVADGEDNERRAAFDVRAAPYTVHADVMLPRAPRRGSMDVRVEVDTIALDVRVGCGVATAAGVRPATAVVAGPRWAGVRLGRVEQAPGVCADGRASEGVGRSVVRRMVERVGVSVGYGATKGTAGVVVAGAGVLLGLRVWP